MAIDVASLQATLGLDKKNFDKGVADASSSFRSFSGGLGKAAIGVGAGAVAGLGLAVGAVGVSAFSTAADIESAAAAMQASLGVTADQAQELAQTGVDVFKNNFAESIGDASAAVALTATQLKNIEFSELQSATENAFRLSDAFGVDLGSSLNAVNVLMTQFGLTQQQSFDFLTTGFQRGLDSSGDFIDSVTEYGNLFGQAGADAAQFWSVLESGAQGGVLGTDKAADLFKEFGIRIQEGTASQREALSALGVDSDALFAGMSDGSISVISAFEAIQEALGQIQDPLQRNALGTELMGTQFEDLGANAVAGISTASTSMSELEGTTSALDAQYDTLGAKFETIGRQATTALAPIGEQLVAVAESALPLLEQGLISFQAGLEAVGPLFTQFGADLAATWEVAGPIIAEGLASIAQSLGLAGPNADAAGVAMTALGAVLDGVVIGVQAATIIITGIATALENVSAFASDVTNTISSMNDALGNITSGGLDSITSAFEKIKSSIPRWLIPGSPPPLYYALQDVNRVASQVPNLAEGYGFNQVRGNPVGALAGVGGNSGGGVMPTDQPIIIHQTIMLDGQVVAQTTSRHLGKRQADDNAMGGATKL